MQNIYTLIKKREVKGEWYKHWDGLERVDWEAKSVFECSVGKKACVFGVVIEN